MQTHSANPVPELPTLDPGLTHLDATSSTGPLHSLVIDHLYTTDDTALWVDSNNNATTHQLTRLAPSDRILSQIDVARAFTAYQHFSITETLAETVDDTTSLVVAPAVDGLYSADDLQYGDGEELLTATIETLQQLSTTFDIPILLTTTGTGSLATNCIDPYIDEYIECRSTRFGPRFTSDEFETLVYPGNGYVQTTLKFWQHILQARHSSSTSAQPPEASVYGTN